MSIILTLSILSAEDLLLLIIFSRRLLSRRLKVAETREFLLGEAVSRLHFKENPRKYKYGQHKEHTM
jgi:hypothetical protein